MYHQMAADNGSGRQGLPSSNQTRMFSTTCAAGLSQSGLAYGSLPLGEFIFEVDPGVDAMILPGQRLYREAEF